jgi:hypothetical protein
MILHKVRNLHTNDEAGALIFIDLTKIFVLNEPYMLAFVIGVLTLPMLSRLHESQKNNINFYVAF